MLPLITSCDYGPIVISDHCPLTMRLRIMDTQSTYRPWRLNHVLLSDDVFISFIASEISGFLDINQTPGMSSLTIWESHISYCANQRRVSTARLNQN